MLHISWCSLIYNIFSFSDACNGSGINDLNLSPPKCERVNCEKEDSDQLVSQLKNESSMKFQIDACNSSGINELKVSFESTKV